MTETKHTNQALNRLQIQTACYGYHVSTLCGVGWNCFERAAAVGNSVTKYSSIGAYFIQESPQFLVYCPWHYDYIERSCRSVVLYHNLSSVKSLPE